MQGRIASNKKDGTVTFDANTMWQSLKTAQGWVSVQLAFPYEVELTRIAVHSQHSGAYDAARAVQVYVRDGDQPFRPISKAFLKSADDMVVVQKTKSRMWRLDFQAGESGFVVLRGLRFYSNNDEIFPPVVPYQP